MPLDSGGGVAPPGGFPNEDLKAAVRAVRLGLGRLGLHDMKGSTSGSDGKKKTKTKHGEKEMEEGSSDSDSCWSSRSMSSSSDLSYKKKKKRRRLVKRGASESTTKDVSVEQSRDIATMRFKSRAD